MRQARRSGPWSNEQVEGFLDKTVVPVRLACNNAEGFPRVTALWFVVRDGALWCATLDSSWVAVALGRDRRCGFDVSVEQPPYRGVRGEAEAVFVPELGGEILGECIDRYLGSRDSDLARWLLSRADREVALRLEPRRLVSWDYSERMKDAQQPES